MHLNAIKLQIAVFLQGSSAVFLQVFKKPPASSGEVLGVFLGIPAACRNHLCSKNPVWPGVNFHFDMHSLQAGCCMLTKHAKTAVL